MDLHTAQWDRSRGWSVPLPGWDGEQTLVVAFGAAGLIQDADPIRELAKQYPRSRIAGCSTAGEIFGGALCDDTLTVAVARFESTTVTCVTRQVPAPADSYDAGRDLGERLTRAADPAAIFVLSDGIGVNGTALTAGLVEGTGGQVVITGGLAGDGSQFQDTWVIVDGEPRGGFVQAVSFEGPRFAGTHGTGGGWGIFGPRRRVTRSTGNVLYELDDQPALALYKTYLGDRAAELPASALLFPLAIRAPDAPDRELVRTILGVDERTQSMTFAGDVPEGAMAQLMRADFDRLVDGAQHAAVQAMGGPGPDDPVLALAVSCVGRRLLMGQYIEDELDAVAAELTAGTEMIGFYSYGEIAPVGAGPCDLHNQTMTLTTVREVG